LPQLPLQRIALVQRVEEEHRRRLGERPDEVGQVCHVRHAVVGAERVLRGPPLDEHPRSRVVDEPVQGIELAAGLIVRRRDVSTQSPLHPCLVTRPASEPRDNQHGNALWHVPETRERRRPHRLTIAP
jgi:hypothetical protein